MNKEQKTLFDAAEFTDWENEWHDMPEFISENKKPSQQIIVSFRNFDDVKKFAALLNIKVTPKTKSTWYPPKDIDKGFSYKNKNWNNEK